MSKHFRPFSPSWALVAAPLVLLMAGCPSSDAQPSAIAHLRDASGDVVATAHLRKIDEGVLVELRGDDVPPGVHAFHVHETGSCEAPDFESAGSHLAAAGAHHGLAADGEHAHTGDLANVIADDDGRVLAYRVVTGADLDDDDGEADAMSLLREGGTALVMHADPDDYRTDPAGAAGTRIACGVIERS